MLDRGGKAPLVLERRFDQLHRHPVRREAVFLQHLRKRTELLALDCDERIDVEKKQLVRLEPRLDALDRAAATEPAELPDEVGLGGDVEHHLRAAQAPHDAAFQSQYLRGARPGFASVRRTCPVARRSCSSMARQHSCRSD